MSAEPAPESLLTFLDADPGRAEERYRRLRDKLIKFFEWNGCHQAEDLADETVFRVMRRLSEGVSIRRLDEPYLFFHGVAVHVLAEWRRRKERSEQPLEGLRDRADRAWRASSTALAECVRESLKRLTSEALEVLESYYLDDHRVDLASRLDLSPNALRIRVHRIKIRLLADVKACIERERPVETRRSPDVGRRKERSDS